MIPLVYFIHSAYGSYCLTVSSIEEAIFASCGDRSVIMTDCSVPSVLDDWYESNTDDWTWDSDSIDADELENPIRILKVTEGYVDGCDVTEVVRKYLTNLGMPFVEEWN